MTTTDERPVKPGRGLRKTKTIPPEAQVLAFANFTVTESGCMESTYSKMRNGYCTISVGGVSYLAHRAAWTYMHGPIAQGLVVDHMCGNRACVRTDHLRLLTLRENTRSRLGIDVPPGQCRNGHPDSDMAVRPSGKGKMQNICTSCLRDRNRARSAQKTARRLAAQAEVSRDSST